MYKKLLTACVFLVGSSAYAAPVLVTDTYIGSDDHGWGDVIGSAANFNIHNMVVDLVGTQLSVTINTNFRQGTGLGTFASYTNTAYGLGNGIGFGDLFLSSAGWNPYGPAPYYGDDAATGTVWDYGVSLHSRWNGVSSAATLYDLDTSNGNTDVLLSEQFVAGATFRNGQEVAVNTATATAIGPVSNVQLSGGQVVFLIDIAGTALAGASEIGLHWGLTCGNDTIEGAYTVVNVPEPTTVAMFLFGCVFLGLASIRRRKMSEVFVLR